MNAGVLEIDLRSDTVTKPTPVMRKAMAEAEVGDDVYREDPTVIKLEKLVAERLGKEAALFVPSGTMGNLSSIMAHCWERGREVLIGDQSHIYLFEQAGVSQLAGVHLRAVRTKSDGTFDLDELLQLMNPNPNIHCCITGLLCLENTNNRCGGLALPVEYTRKVCQLAKSFGIPVHMDGARLYNASVYSGESVASLVRDCDSVSMCLSKGLGAPVGSVVAGSKEFISRVLRCRKVLGGAMRQVGVLAAAGLVALQGIEERIRRDHEHALRLANAISQANTPLVTVDLAKVHTNMVVLYFRSGCLSAEEFVERMKEVSDSEIQDLRQKISVKIHLWCSTEVRCVFHSDISEEAVEAAIKKIVYIIKQFSSSRAVNSLMPNGMCSTEDASDQGDKESSSKMPNLQKLAVKDPAEY